MSWRCCVHHLAVFPMPIIQAPLFMLGRCRAAQALETFMPLLTRPLIFVYRVNYFFLIFWCPHNSCFLCLLAKEIVVISLLVVLSYSLFSNALYFIVQRESSYCYQLGVSPAEGQLCYLLHGGGPVPPLILLAIRHYSPESSACGHTYPSKPSGCNGPLQAQSWGPALASLLGRGCSRFGSALGS